MKRDLGNAIRCLTALSPQTIGTGSTEDSENGYGIDRKGYESITFAFVNTQPAGTPLGVTITCHLEESADDVTYTNVDTTLYSSASVTHNVTNTYSCTEVSVADATGLKQYVRGVIACQFNGGTGPYVYVTAVAVLGSPKDFPAPDYTT